MSMSAIEFQGWISVCFNEKQSFSINELTNITKSINQYDNQTCELHHFNGSIMMWVAGNHNHNNGCTEDLLDLLQKISIFAPLSYGLIYVRLCEDELIYNQFKVYKLCKGNISIEDDNFLSPCGRVIEKEEP